MVKNEKNGSSKFFFFTNFVSNNLYEMIDFFLKILHEASTKDNRIMCLDGQVSKLQKTLDVETGKVSKLTIELERTIASSNKNHELLEQKEQGTLLC